MKEAAWAKRIERRGTPDFARLKLGVGKEDL